MAELVETVRSGDRRESLEALRDRLASVLVGAEPSNVAALAKQLREVMAELDGLDDGAEVDVLDELAARRPSDAKVPVRASGGRERS